jgi:siroheme synthase-like protein
MLHLAIDVADQPVLVLGAGRIGARKAAQLLDAGARVRVIASELLTPLPDGLDEVCKRPYRAGDLEGAFLVVSATGDQATNDQIVSEASAERIWLNVVDDPERSSFFFPATHRRGEVVLSVSTEGAAPALAQTLRDLLADALPENLAQAASQLRAERDALHGHGLSTEDVDWSARILELLSSEASSAQPTQP